MSGGRHAQQRPQNLVKGWRLTGEIACAVRRWDEAHTALNEALVVAKTIRNPAAQDAYRAARAVVDGMLAALTTPHLRASLERLAAVRELTQDATRG